MASIKLIFSSVCLLVVFQEIHSHGMMMDPVSRSSAHKKGFGTPANWNDNGLNCGGQSVQHQTHGGKCGVCGDNYGARQPRDNENGGLYGTGTIARTYHQGQRTTVEIKLTANHEGHFEFAVCPLKGRNDIETEECFARYPVRLANGDTKYIVQSGVHNFKFDVVLPQGLTCQHCSFRWHYRTGKDWGICEDGNGNLGCGPQETFRNCADISIV